MRTSPFLPALALLLFLPARADESAISKASAAADGTGEKARCCTGEEKVTCAKANAAASSKKRAAKKSPASATAKPGAAGAASIVVTRDPETGEIRHATAEERAKLLGRRTLVAPAEPQVVILPDGTEMVVLGESAMSYAVARRNPDGTVMQSCVEGPEAADAARKPKPDAPAPKSDVR